MLVALLSCGNNKVIFVLFSVLSAGFLLVYIFYVIFFSFEKCFMIGFADLPQIAAPDTNKIKYLFLMNVPWNKQIFYRI